VKLDSRGPILFVDRRVGVGEREFGMLKFRTMVVDAGSLQPQLEAANEAEGALFKIRDDPRVTRVGRALRRLSLDESRSSSTSSGQMSLVGRPLPLRTTDSSRTGIAPARRAAGHDRPGRSPAFGLTFDDLVRLDFTLERSIGRHHDHRRTLAVVMRRARGGRSDDNWHLGHANRRIPASRSRPYSRCERSLRPGLLGFAAGHRRHRRPPVRRQLLRSPPHRPRPWCSVVALWKACTGRVDLVVTPYRGRPVIAWWRVAPNPTYREGVPGRAACSPA
jgi:hypothetical protein